MGKSCPKPLLRLPHSLPLKFVWMTFPTAISLTTPARIRFLFGHVKSGLIKTIAEIPTDGEYALDLLMISKYFERIGDHAVNIAEWVLFSITGVHKEMDG